jgi:hypothetical protein
MTAVVLMMDPARLIAAARFFGSFSAGSWNSKSKRPIRTRRTDDPGDPDPPGGAGGAPLLAAALAAPEALAAPAAARLVELFCFVAMSPGYQEAAGRHRFALPRFFGLTATHFPWLSFLPLAHFFDFALEPAFTKPSFDATAGAEKFPTPSNVTLAGVANTGGAAGTP